MNKNKFCRIIFLAAMTSAGIIGAESSKQKVLAEEVEVVVENEITEQSTEPVLNESTEVNSNEDVYFLLADLNQARLPSYHRLDLGAKKK